MGALRVISSGALQPAMVVHPFTSLLGDKQRSTVEGAHALEFKVCILPLPSCVILRRLLDLSFLQSPVYVLRIIIPTSKVMLRIRRDNVCVSKVLA